MKRLFFTLKINGLKVSAAVLVFCMTILLVACTQNYTGSEQINLDESMTQIYYIDASETKVVGEEYVPVGKTRDALVLEYLEALSTDPKSYFLKKAKPDSLEVEKYNFNEDGGLSIYFNSDYSNLTGISEVLARAAIVKTLSQIEGIDSIEFYVSGQPLMGTNGKSISFMDPEDFIDNTGAEDVYVTVYFSNEEGTALVDSNLKITYNGNISIEQLVIERLISGPIEKHMIKTIPEGTKLIKVTTKDGICYVDFNNKFLDKITGINDKVVIYSIVNSLDELSTINKVQFTINGAAKKNYREGIDFDSFFERNLELVEGAK
jgi:germination protein M